MVQRSKWASVILKAMKIAIRIGEEAIALQPKGVAFKGACQ